MDTSDLMWDGASADLNAERRELARTAALADTERLVGQFVYLAANDIDLANRLALAESQLQAVASLRGYPVAELTADLTRRWQLLSTAKKEAAQKTAARRAVTAAQERGMDAAVAHLAATAARENPSVPMATCLKLATEAVRKHADAYPLAYESWGGAADGPITDRAKHWRPGGMPKALPESAGRPAADPGAAGGTGTFDEVNRRLDDLEGRTNPAAATTATASLEPTVAGFYQRLKDWWRHGPDAAPSTFAPATHPEPPAASHELLHGFDDAKHEMDKKWDANAAAPGASPEYTTQHASDDLLSGFDKARGEMSEKWDANLAGPGASEHYRPPVPSGFSHADTGHGTGQAPLPTDPAGHGFSHAEPAHTSPERRDWNIPTHFQHGASLFE
jgi:hypothetical protein